jgi:CheY-like chemotaxis protein
VHVLVVDDNPDAVEILSLLLQGWGHDVRTASSGPQAIEEVQTYHPEVVLMDIGLPGMDGYQVAQRMRTEASAKQPVLVALTGYGEDEDYRRSREAGFDHHLLKPVSSVLLQRLLARVSDHYSRACSQIGP